jgi:hypothetical protein
MLITRATTVIASCVLLFVSVASAAAQPVTNPPYFVTTPGLNGDTFSTLEAFL